MRIAIASGKGGTGKTTLATNLAVVLAESGVPVAYLDCDVEEPNGHLFLKPTITDSAPVSVPVPVVDEERCTWCGACAKACRYSAILMLPQKILTFPQLCHGCGGCLLACEAGAISEQPRSTGVVEQGRAGAVEFRQGRLNVGEAMAPPVVRAVLATAPLEHTLIIDAPPGTSCPVIAAAHGADLVLLVTEPTPFGLHDLKLAVAMVRELGLPFAVAINRAGIGDQRVTEYCVAEQIPIVFELPYDREIATAYSHGELAVRAVPALRQRFLELFNNLAGLACLAPPPRPSPAMPASPSTSVPARLPSAQTSLTERAAVQELVVLSGKGGTGKTSLVASFCALAAPVTAVDCDVDAADLHLVLAPQQGQRWPFSAGHTATLDAARCTLCGLCVQQCRFDAISFDHRGAMPVVRVDALACEGCGVCADLCPERAIELAPGHPGEWFVATTRFGPLVHARLGPAQENSGKLVSLVRREARAVAAAEGHRLLIADGSPGIGCPVIASVTGASLVLLVTEPTPSGLHDLTRVAELTRRFAVETGVCINKADLNPAMTNQIEMTATALGLSLWGRVRYDDTVTEAQLRGVSVVELGPGPAADDVRALWQRVEQALAEKQRQRAPASSQPLAQRLSVVPLGSQSGR